MKQSSVQSFLFFPQSVHGFWEEEGGGLVKDIADSLYVETTITQTLGGEMSPKKCGASWLGKKRKRPLLLSLLMLWSKSAVNEQHQCCCCWMDCCTVLFGFYTRSHFLLATKAFYKKMFFWNRLWRYLSDLVYSF